MVALPDPAKEIAALKSRVGVVENTVKTSVRADISAAHARVDALTTETRAQMASHWRWIAVIGLASIAALAVAVLVAAGVL